MKKRFILIKKGTLFHFYYSLNVYKVKCVLFPLRGDLWPLTSIVSKTSPRLADVLQTDYGA